ncbi:MAG: lipopolysaccharide assembly LapA domain-containing protein [Candidatus Eisenbacteria bacterium]|nr:LapA family protein [Candidatus Eisenbacteria bacterium]
MSLVKLLLGIAFMSAILFFAVLNLDETVDIKLWTDAAHAYPDVPLVVAMFCAYLLGIVTYFVITLARDIRARTQIARLRRENRALLDELHHLRGSALDDLPTIEAQGGEILEGRRP